MRRFSIITAAGLMALAACSGSPNFSGSGSTSGTSGTGGTGTGGTTSYSMGNGSGTGFQAGMLGISSANISAGGTTSLAASVVDQTGALYNAASVTVAFSSTCINQGLATVTGTGTTTAGSSPNTVQTSNGTIDATYTAVGCSGPDVITATSTVAGANLSATGTVTVAAAAIGSIQFESATPPSIGLKGTGLNETSTVVFKVVDSTGGARPGVTVTFSLNTTVGGLSMSPMTAVSGNDGTVQTVVSAGTEHTAVRVTATIASPALSTQSSSLTVTTGLPASNAFSIAVGAPNYGSLACPNVEAYGIDLVTVPVTVQLADRYNNPAPDGTSVAFTTDGGHITGSCTTPFPSTATGNGICQATWTSANPRPTTSSTPAVYRNGRAMILATAIGEESFDDNNGSGFYQAGDAFSDLGEPYLDANESGSYLLGDYFLDFYNTGKWEGPSGAFKGITCSGGSCSTTTLAIGVSHLLIMSTSAANINSIQSTGSLNGAPEKTGIGIQFRVQDQNGNPMAAGTTVTAVADTAIGTLTGPGTSFTIGCRTGGGPDQSNPGYDTLGVNLTTASAPGSGNITITVTSPESKTATIVTLPVSVN